MFKQIARDKITAAEIKKRIFAYAHCQTQSLSSSTSSWYGNTDTYTLNLRLSGIYQEQPIRSSYFNERNEQTTPFKYPYLSSKIFIQATSYLKPTEFIRFVYQAFLGRKADPGGLATNLQKLQAGVSRIKIVHIIRSSEEAHSFFLKLTDCLSDQYFSQLLRKIYLDPQSYELELPNSLDGDLQQPPRSQMLQDWQQFQQLQIALAERRQDFGRTDKSVLNRGANLTNENFIRQLYLSYLQREADPEGLQNQVAQLESGTPRNQVLFNLRTSTEAINVFVNLTADLDNITFLNLAYRIYHKAKLSSAQKQFDLEKLESGLERQAILAKSYIREPHPSPDYPELNEQKVISESDRPQIWQHWQVQNSEFIQCTDHLNNDQFISQAYQFFLQRQITTTELTHHQQQFKHNPSRLDFLQQTKRSSEAANLFVQITEDLTNQQFLDAAYNIYFQQPLEPTDNLVYLQFLERGNPRIEILD